MSTAKIAKPPKIIQKSSPTARSRPYCALFLVSSNRSEPTLRQSCRKAALLPQATCSVRLTAGCFGKLNMTDKENSKYSLSSCQCKAGKQFLPLVILSNVEGSRGNETSLYMCHFTSFRSREIATLALAMTTTLSLEQNKTKK